MTRALAIVNPAAGGGRGASAWARVTAVAEHRRDYECVLTDSPGHARRLAREAAAGGYQRIVAVGGDGTVSEVAGGLVGSDAALGIVPAGNGNDFSRALGLPRVPERAAWLALRGATRRVDLGRVQVGQQCTVFVNVAGCGFDAEVVRRTASGRHARGALLYLMGIVQTLSAFRPLPLRLVLDGQPIVRRALGVAVAIGPRYGGGMRIAPQAVLDDGLFDICVVGDLSPTRLLALLPRLYAGTHTSHSAVEFFRCRELRVEALAPREVCCQADGELLDGLPAVFSIESRALVCVAGEGE
jgi:diacylglycerol kinase (ATP)